MAGQSAMAMILTDHERESCDGGFYTTANGHEYTGPAGARQLIRDMIALWQYGQPFTTIVPYLPGHTPGQAWLRQVTGRAFDYLARRGTPYDG